MITITIDPVVALAVIVLIALICFRGNGPRRIISRPEPPTGRPTCRPPIEIKPSRPWPPPPPVENVETIVCPACDGESSKHPPYDCACCKGKGYITLKNGKFVR